MPLANSRFASAGALVLIEEIVLAADGVLNFDAIPATFKDLRLSAMVRSNEPAVSTAGLNLRYNGDAGLNYDRCQLVSNAAGTLSSVSATNAQAQAFLADQPAALSQADTWAALLLEISDYRSARRKQAMYRVVSNDPGGGGFELAHGLVAWRSNAVIDRVEILALGFAFLAGSRGSLYGVS